MTATDTASPSHVVYVANAESCDISVLALEPASGELAEIERFKTAGAVMPLAVSADRRVLYASIRSEPCLVQSLAIDPRSGRLAEIGRATLPASMCWISTDRSGRYLLSAAYGDHLVAVSPINADGVAGEALQVLDTGRHAHSIRTDPANRYAFVACLGDDVLAGLRFDGGSGQLIEHTAATYRGRQGAGPRHFVFHPQQPRVYLLNELDASIDVLAYDGAAGGLDRVQTVSVLPADFAGGAPWAAEIRMTADGRFVYASERRSNTIAAFRIDASDGRLVGVGSVATEAQPRGVAVTPDGRHLFAVGQASHSLSRYRIDTDSGALSWLGRQAVGRDPNWIEVVVLPD